MENFEIKEIVYDVDDVLWGLNERVCKINNINVDYVDNFIIQECDKLSPEQHAAILRTYNQADTFKDIEWYEDVERISLFNAKGVKVFINSNSLTEEMRELKRNQLSKVVTIPQEQMIFNLITHKTATKKEIAPTTDILVEDSPFNISTSPAKLNIIINHPWNMTEKAEKIMKNKNIVRVNSLKEANSLIEKLLQNNKTPLC